jgi:hypothetical protein
LRTFAHHLVAVSLVASAASAAAEPCAVTIPRAPADVRATVESWVESEPACRVSLEVRIVPSDGGLYVLARDERGRTYERIVPDAQSAGVLVASWMADDSMPSAPAPAAPPPRVAIEEPAVAETPAIDEPAGAPAVVQRVLRPGPSRWLAVEGMVGASATGGDVRGLRAEVDLVSVGRWSFGATLSYGVGGVSLSAVSPEATEVGPIESTIDIKATAYAVRQIDLGGWHVRPGFGLGGIRTTVAISDRNYPAQVMAQTIRAASLMGELSFVISRDLGASWAVQGGILLDLDPQTVPVASTQPDSFASVHRSMDLVLAFGVGRRL